MSKKMKEGEGITKPLTRAVETIARIFSIREKWPYGLLISHREGVLCKSIFDDGAKTWHCKKGFWTLVLLILGVGRKTTILGAQEFSASPVGV
jgi:hypothetical protein